MELYEPLNVPKPVGEDLWLVDGPVVRMSYLWGSFPFPTRMAVVRLRGGDLLLWSPTAPDEGLRSRIDALGRVRHLVSPNKFHYAHIAAWKRAYPEATAWASPGVRERAASQHIDVSFDADLGEAPAPAWRGEVDQLVFRGSRLLEEVIFFHHKTRTVPQTHYARSWSGLSGQRLRVPQDLARSASKCWQAANCRAGKRRPQARECGNAP